MGVSIVIKLIKLELRKLRISRYVKGMLLANVIIMGLILFIGYMAEGEPDIPFTSFETAFIVIDTFTRATFIVFAGALIARLFINEYKNKTMMVMFMYPINRKRLLIAKLLIVVAFTFCSIVLSTALQLACFWIFNAFTHVVPGTITVAFLKESAGISVMNALAASMMSLISLYVGMRKHSVTATIISSVLIVMVVCQYFGDTPLNSIIIIPIMLSVLGATAAYLSIRNIEQKDLL